DVDVREVESRTHDVLGDVLQLMTAALGLHARPRISNGCETAAIRRLETAMAARADVAVAERADVEVDLVVDVHRVRDRLPVYAAHARFDVVRVLRFQRRIRDREAAGKRTLIESLIERGRLERARKLNVRGDRAGLERCADARRERAIADVLRLERIVDDVVSRAGGDAHARRDTPLAG